MSLEQAIHAHWTQCEELSALLPADRLTTGRGPGDGTVRATIERTGCRPLLPTNAGWAVEEITLRVRLWHEDYDAGHAILEAASTALDGVVLDVNGGARHARLRRTGHAIVQQPDRRWEFQLTLSAWIGEL